MSNLFGNKIAVIPLTLVEKLTYSRGECVLKQSKKKPGSDMIRHVQSFAGDS